MNDALRLALAVLAAAACLPASAQIRGAGSITHFTATVTDLDPADGIAPVLQYEDPVNVGLGGSLLVALPHQNSWYDNTGKSVAGPGVFTHDDAPYAYSGASYDGKSIVAAASLAPVRDGTFDADMQAGTLGRAFRLAPHTSVTFTADLALDLALDPGKENREWGQGSVYLALDHSIDGRWDNPGTGDAVSAWVGTNQYGEFRPQAQLFKTVSATWDNTGDTWEEGLIGTMVDLWIDASGTPVVPVPEPGEWAMLAAGGAVLALRGRHFRRKRDA